MSNKKLVFDSDSSGAIKGLSKIEKSLRDINTQGTNIGKRFDNIFKSDRIDKFAKQIKNLNKEFQALKGFSKDISKDLGDLFKPNTKELENAVSKIKELKEEIRKLGSVSGQTGGVTAAISSGDVSGTGDSGKQVRLNKLKEEQDRVGGGVRDISRGFGAVGGVFSGISSLAGAYQNTKNLEMANLAGLTGFQRNLINENLGGLSSTFYFGNKKAPGSTLAGGTYGEAYAKTAMRDAGGTTSAYLGMLGQAGSSAAQIGIGVAGLAMPLGAAGRAAGALGGGGGTLNQMAGLGAIGGVGDLYRTSKNIMGGGAQLAEHNSVVENLGLRAEQSPFEQAMLGYLNSAGALYTSTGKGLQGMNYAARGIGLSGGLSTEESMTSAASMARRYGVGALMGGSGNARVARGMNQADAYATASRQFPFSQENQWELENFASKIRNEPQPQIKMGRGGADYSVPVPEGVQNEYNRNVNTYQAMMGETAVIEGKRQEKVKELTKDKVTGKGTSLFQTSIDYERRGMSKEGAYEMFARAGMAAGSVEQGTKQLENVFSTGIKKGFTDSVLLEKLGSTIGKYSTRGADTYGFGTAMMFGMESDRGPGGWNQDAALRNARRMENVEAGLGAIDRIGSNTYFDTMKTSYALKNLGPGATASQAALMAGSSMTELMKGGAAFNALEISDDARIKTFKDSMNVQLMAGLGSEYSPDIMDKLKKTGGKGPLWDKVAASIMKPMGLGSMEEAEGYLSAYAGFEPGAKHEGAVVKGQKYGGGSFESANVAREKMITEILTAISEKKKEIADALAKQTGKEGMALATDQNIDFGKFKEAMEAFIKILNHPGFQKAVESSAKAGGPTKG